MTKTFLKTAGRLVGALGVVALFSTASFAEARVWVRTGDGRVVYTTRSYWHRHYPAGVIVAGLPGGYVNTAFGYEGGYPVYYHQNWWRAHHHDWHHWHGHRHGHWH
jgi:hypothetical protein